jgi:hypothetical protein
MIKKLPFYLVLLMAGFALLVSGCADDSDDNGDDGPNTTDTASDTQTSLDSATTVDTATVNDTGTTPDTATLPDTSSDTASGDTGTSVGDTGTGTASVGDGNIGAPCSCSGTACEMAGVPIPNAGDAIVGCEGVPADHVGARVCLRSYSGQTVTQTYFANGYCELQSIGNCVGADIVCGSATFGDYANMTSCPAGTVMLEMSVETSMAGGLMSATMDSRACVKSCTTDAECRVGETDAAFGGEASQYGCIDKDGVKFCYDPRNLSETYSATLY